MTIRINPAGLARTKWHEYAVRFVFGELIHRGGGLNRPSLRTAMAALPCLSGDLSGKRDASLKTRYPEEETRRPAGCHPRARSGDARCGRSRARLQRPCRIRDRCLATAGSV